MLNSDASGAVRIEAVPCACEDCDDRTKREHGCGFDPRYAGKSKADIASTRAEEPYSRTCPQFYLQQPATQEVYADLRDYRRGAIDIDAIPAAYLTLLREGDSAEEEWGRVQQDQLRDQAKARAKAEAD